MLDRTVVDNNVNGTTYDTSNGNTNAKVIPIRPSQISQQAEHTADYQQNIYRPSTSPYKYDTRRAPLPKYRVPRSDISQKTLSEDDKWYLREALLRITDSMDSEFEPVERSNCFDEWKDLLGLIARKAKYLSINHSEILGTLISITHRRDHADYTSDTLKVFRDATSLLRQPRMTKQDSKRIRDKLLALKIKTTIPIGTECLHEDQINSLEHMMSALIEKSTSDK